MQTIAAKDKKIIKLKKKNASVKNKMNALIIVSVLIYLMCRLPEILINILTSILPLLIPEFICITSVLGYIVSDSIQYIYTLSYVFNILLYYKFNNNFKLGLRNYFSLKKKTDQNASENIQNQLSNSPILMMCSHHEKLRIHKYKTLACFFFEHRLRPLNCRYQTEDLKTT